MTGVRIGIEWELGTPYEEIKRMVLRASIEACGNNRSMAARKLGIQDATIIRQLGHKNREDAKAQSLTHKSPNSDEGDAE